MGYAKYNKGTISLLYETCKLFYCGIKYIPRVKSFSQILWSRISNTEIGRL